MTVGNLGFFNYLRAKYCFFVMLNINCINTCQQMKCLLTYEDQVEGNFVKICKFGAVRNTE